MSTKELSRLEVIERLSKRQMSQKEAGELLHLGTRQIKRLLKRYRKQGASGLISKQRGRKSNNRLTEDVKKAGLNLLKTNIKDLVQRWRIEVGGERQLQLSVESVRKLMIEEGCNWCRPNLRAAIRQKQSPRLVYVGAILFVWKFWL